jgi:hypothetical protein
VPGAVRGALAAHAGAILAEEAHLAQAVEADARAGAARGAQPVARAVLRAHPQHDGAVGTVEARIAEALAEGARAVARAVGGAAAKRRDDAAVVALEAGLAEAAAVPRARLALAQALAVRRAVVRAAAHHNAAVAAGVPKVALALACQGAAHRGVLAGLVCWVQRGGAGVAGGEGRLTGRAPRGCSPLVQLPCPVQLLMQSGAAMEQSLGPSEAPPKPGSQLHTPLVQMPCPEQLKGQSCCTTSHLLPVNPGLQWQPPLRQ